jgi:transposase
MIILAIDLGKFNSVACRYDTATNDATFQRFETDRRVLAHLLQEHRPQLVVVEACSLAGWVSDLCQEHEVQLIVASTSDEAWKWKHLKRKTDRDDALKLAKLAVLEQLTPVHTPAKAVRETRSLIRHRKALVGQRNRIQNHLRALLVSQGLPMRRGAKAWSQAGLDELRARARPLAECDAENLWRGQIALQLQLLAFVEAQVKAVEAKLDQLGAASDAVQVLESTPGIGRRTAEVVVAWLDRPERFENGRQVSAYAGLVPRRYQSGEMDRSGRITRRGPKLLRSMLVEVAWIMLRYNPWAQKTYARLAGRQRTRKKQAIVGLARKLLVRLWAMLRDGTAWSART